MKRINYHLTDLQIKGLDKLSAKTGLSRAELIRRSIDAFLEAQLGQHKPKSESKRQ